MKTFVYIHACVIGAWKDIIENQLSKILNYGLYNQVDEVRVCLYGDQFERQKAKNFLHSIIRDKLNIRFETDNITLGEKNTLEILSEDSHNEDDFKALYLHTKGNSSKFDNNKHMTLCVRDWVDYMLYFNVVRWNECVELLDKFDVCGVNLQIDSRSYTKGWHYSGNFWWANSGHIKKLRTKIESMHPSGSRLDAEQWLCSESFCAASLWQSQHNHYKDRYESLMYENKEINILKVVE